MKWLLIVVLVFSVLVSGCSKSNFYSTGFECYVCKEEVSGEARTCPHCGQPFNSRGPTSLNRVKEIEDEPYDPRNDPGEMGFDTP